MKQILACCAILFQGFLCAQVPVSLEHYNRKNRAAVTVAGNDVAIKWPAGPGAVAQIRFDLDKSNPLFRSISITSGKQTIPVAASIDPVFLLTVGKRDLVSQNGWNIFFDKVHLKPYQTHRLLLEKDSVSVTTTGSRSVISLGKLSAPGFSGRLEVTCYNGSPLFNVAAVMTTLQDSTAIVYDAGLVSRGTDWSAISFADVRDQLQQYSPAANDTAVNVAVKYRTIIGQSQTGSIAVFPAPHQYFYPLDEAFNLKFTWYGNQYRKMIDGFGLGIRQPLDGDHRFVPWFNAPPATRQRLNFFCMVAVGKAEPLLKDVKAFTHNDTYLPVAGYKRMASHFHNEFIMQVVLAGKPVPEKPEFISYFENAGIDIVHLGEFHYTAHPKGPDSLRLKELKALFDQCSRLSTDKFLLLPGEEPNEFLGGHWLQLFPRPVYWIMSRSKEQPFVTTDPELGKVYRVGDTADMLRLLQLEKGLAWTAHPRTKGSTGYPDKYANEGFFKSDRFLGAAWKAMPADLSQPRLGKRVLDLMDDLNNQGFTKKIIAEADLFTITRENEMYAHMNLNYLQMDQLPSFKNGWQPVLDAVGKGRFFSTTGEVLIPAFTINNKGAGDTVMLTVNKKATLSFRVKWTFPLQFAELISGDGNNVYRERINLNSTLPFGDKIFRMPVDLHGRKWARLEIWDAAVNGAFTQTVYLR